MSPHSSRSATPANRTSPATRMTPLARRHRPSTGMGTCDDRRPMIPTDILFSPLAIAGFATGIVVAFLAGRIRGDPGPVIVMSAIGSGLALAGLAWANAFGGGPLFA